MVVDPGTFVKRGGTRDEIAWMLPAETATSRSRRGADAKEEILTFVARQSTLECRLPRVQTRDTMRELWIASNNAKKRGELQRLLDPLGIRSRRPDELGAPFAPLEDQPDFAGNARKKAELLAQLAGGVALADDSGLCVDALDGRPGVHSARYGGPGLTDRQRLAALLAELAGVPAPRRTAHFTCSLCVCGPDGAVLAAIEATCEGTLLAAPAGDGGFGYDPIFVPLQFAGDPARTFAHLDAATKDHLSHRGKALRQLRERLPDLLRGAGGRGR